MTSLFLTDAELEDMTKRSRKHAQRHQLEVMGIQYRMRGDGSLAVHRLHVEQMFGAAPRVKASAQRGRREETELA